MDKKRCSKCGEEKPLSQFYAKAASRDGKRPNCKECHNVPTVWDTPEQRFWKKVIRGGADDCWEWTGSTATNNGYGRHPMGNSHVIAHRFSWQIHNGSIPTGLRVLHKCDNPKCVNPNHLFLGTSKDNGQDMVMKGRGGGQKLKPDQVRTIKQLLQQGERLQKIANLFGVSRTTIGHIKNGENWGWLNE